MITLLSGFNTKDRMGPLLADDFPIRQFCRLISLREMFLNSIHSELGKLTEGDGSDMISSITISYLFTKKEGMRESGLLNAFAEKMIIIKMMVEIVFMLGVFYKTIY
jgi:hypothetical protein